MLSAECDFFISWTLVKHPFLSVQNLSLQGGVQTQECLCAHLNASKTEARYCTESSRKVIIELHREKLLTMSNKRQISGHHLLPPDVCVFKILCSSVFIGFG